MENVHVAYGIYDQYTVPDTVAVKPLLLLLSLTFFLSFYCFS